MYESHLSISFSLALCPKKRTLNAFTYNVYACVTTIYPFSLKCEYTYCNCILFKEKVADIRGKRTFAFIHYLLVCLKIIDKPLCTRYWVKKKKRRASISYKCKYQRSHIRARQILGGKNRAFLLKESSKSIYQNENIGLFWKATFMKKMSTNIY
jgi:hypothetical protein